MPDQKTIYFVIRADEKGPPSGPTFDRALAERWAAAQEDDAWILSIDATAEFVARPLDRRAW